MAYGLWIDGDTAWAEGTHEYRALGSAVIGVNDQFRERDFSPFRRTPDREHRSWVGLFASLRELNRVLGRRRSCAGEKKSGHAKPVVPPYV